jgi:hypothetical protein
MPTETRRAPWNGQLITVVLGKAPKWIVHGSKLEKMEAADQASSRPWEARSEDASVSRGAPSRAVSKRVKSRWSPFHHCLAMGVWQRRVVKYLHADAIFRVD